MDYINDFFQSRKKYGIKPGLKQMKALLEAFGNPEQNLKAIHIAGTNGKGSTLAFLKSALMENGYSVGSFSSPALEAFQEQITINTSQITEEALTELMKEIQPEIQKLDEQGIHPTEFEITVLLAIMYFKEQVDIALIETGMGGKEDATNCVLPMLTIITNVEKDHTSFLGTRYEDIAEHKAGIIKQDIPLVTGALKQVPKSIVKMRAVEKKAHLYLMEKDFSYQRNESDNGFTFQMENQEMKVSTLCMKGEHQFSNAALSLAAIFVLKKIGWQVSLEKSKAAIERTVLPGRFEKLCDSPEIIVDSAHNPAGIASFCLTVKDMYREKEKHLIFAAFRDKDLEEMIAQLDFFSTVTFTTFLHPRAAKAEELYQLSSHRYKIIEPNWEQAIEDLKNTIDKESTVFITGSLAFIGKIRKWVDNNK